MLEEYWVLKNDEGYLTCVVEGTKVDYIVQENWKEAKKFSMPHHADNFWWNNREQAEYNHEWLFWNSMNAKRITIQID